MANFGQIHRKIWKDEWFADLTTKQKLLFIYLFSSEQASLSGIYELPLRVICFETGLSQKDVSEIMAFFTKEGKALYADGVVWIPTLPKYHATRSAKVRIRMLRDVRFLKDCVLKEEYCKLHEIDRVSGNSDRISEDEIPPFIIYSNIISSNIDLKGDSEKSVNDAETVTDKEAEPSFEVVAEIWKTLFPRKPQPRIDNKPLHNKLATRRKEKYFRENWKAALERAAKSELLEESGWFTLGWFLKNQENWEKCFDGNYDDNSGTKQKAEEYTEEQKEHVNGDEFRM